MSAAAASLLERFHKLGIQCDTVPLDHMSSASTTLACFPMYMVANLHAWTTQHQFQVPIVDIPGSEGIREAFTIGEQEGSLELENEHRRLLGSLLRSAKPSDLVIYEYALETLRQFLAAAQPPVADAIRAGVARMTIAVARASGQGLFGSGEKVSTAERACLAQIAAALDLQSSPRAADLLRGIGV